MEGNCEEDCGKEMEEARLLEGSKAGRDSDDENVEDAWKTWSLSRKEGVEEMPPSKLREEAASVELTEFSADEPMLKFPMKKLFLSSMLLSRLEKALKLALSSLLLAAVPPLVLAASLRSEDASAPVVRKSRLSHSAPKTSSSSASSSSSNRNDGVAMPKLVNGDDDSNDESDEAKASDSNLVNRSNMSGSSRSSRSPKSSIILAARWKKRELKEIRIVFFF